MRIYLSVLLAMLALVAHGANPDFDHIKGTGVISAVLTGTGSNRTVWLGGIFDPNFFATNAGRLTLTGSVTNADNWTFSAGTLFPTTANSVTVTNLDVWTRWVNKGATVYETRSRALSLGSNFVALSTNTYLFLTSPTNDPAQVSIFLAGPISSGQEITLAVVDPASAFTLFDGSASGGGFVFILGDFVANASGRGIELYSDGLNWREKGRIQSDLAPAGVNPTIGFLPYNQDGANFGDSPIQRLSATAIGLTSSSNVLFGSGPDLVYTNGSTLVSFFVKNKNNDAGTYGVTGSGRAVIGSTGGGIEFEDPTFHVGAVFLQNNNLNWINNTTVFDSVGAGSPEGVLSASVGSVYRRTNGTAGLTLYVKTNGIGNTGWSPVADGSGSGGGDGTGPFTNSVGTISNTVAGSNFVFTAFVADGPTVAYAMDTAELLTDAGALLLALRNKGTNQFSVGIDNFSFGHPALSAIQGFMNDGALPYANLTLRENVSGHNIEISASGDPATGAYIYLMNGVANDTFFVPASADGVLPFRMTTWTPHTSGNLFEVGNTNSTALSVAWDGGIATPQITASGLVSATWQLGNATNNVSVLASATNHVTATINGVKVAIPYALLP